MPVPTAYHRPPDRRLLRPAAATVLILTGSGTTALADPSSAHSEQGYGPPASWQLQIDPVVCTLGDIEFAGGPGTPMFDDQIYVLLRDYGLILRMNRAGELGLFADLNHAWHTGPYRSPTFDALGNYDGSLLLLAEPYHIGEIDASAAATFFTPGGVDTAPGQNLALGCDPDGAFGGQLFVLNADGQLCTISPCGMGEVFATGFRRGPHAMLFSSGGAFGDWLYVAETNCHRILRVSPDHEVGAPASVWRDLGELSVSPVSMTISRDGIFGTDVMYVSDTKGRIIRLSPSGKYRGLLLTDLPGPAQIEIPASAAFPDCMVVAAAGTIWILYYEHVDLADLATRVGKPHDQSGDAPARHRHTHLMIPDELADAPQDGQSSPDGDALTELKDPVTHVGASP